MVVGCDGGGGEARSLLILMVGLKFATGPLNFANIKPLFQLIDIVVIYQTVHLVWGGWGTRLIHFLVG